MAKHSASKSRLPDYETAICGRLKSFREQLKWSQPDFAEKLGITKVRLASYEYGRAPVKYWLARKAQYEFHLSPVWLATGQPPITGYIALDPKIEKSIPEKELLSAAYHDYFIGSIEMDIALDVRSSSRFDPVVHSIKDRIEILLDDYLSVVKRLMEIYQSPKRKIHDSKPANPDELRQLEELEEALRSQVHQAIKNRPAFMRALVASLGAGPDDT